MDTNQAHLYSWTQIRLIFVMEAQVEVVGPLSIVFVLGQLEVVVVEGDGCVFSVPQHEHDFAAQVQQLGVQLTDHYVGVQYPEMYI